MQQFTTDVKIFQYAPVYNDGIKDYDEEWTTVSRRVHCSQRSFHDLCHFVKLLDPDSVRTTVAGITFSELN